MWLRAAGTIVYLFAAAPLMVSRELPADQWLIAGLLSAALLLAVVGSVNWVIARARKTPRPWWHATFALGPIAISFVLAIMSNAGRDG